MAQRNLLTIIQTAQLELGLAQATQVIGSTDETTNQMYGFANLEIEELRQAHDTGWTALQTEYDLTINVPISTTGQVTVNSAIITGIPTTAGITAGYFMVSGANILAAARVISVDSPTQITMSMPATATSLPATPLLFMQDTYPEPSDFDFFLARTWWDRTNRWELLGPDSPQLDQWHRSGIVTTGPRRHFRQIGAPSYQIADSGNVYRIWPPPGSDVTAPVSIVFEYSSQWPVFSAGTRTRKKLFTLDTDIPVLDDRAVIMGIKWRFWAQKGFDWTSLRTDYDNYVERLVGRDGGNKTLSMVPRSAPLLISPANVQDGYFPGPIGN